MTERDTNAESSPSGALPRWARMALLVLLALVVVGGLVLAALPSPVAVDTATVQRGSMEVAVEEDGRTRLRDPFTVSAPVAGTLERVALRSGDEVEENQELARVRPSPAPLLDARNRAQAQAGVEAAEAGVEQARSRAEAAEAGVVDAREELRRQEVLRTEASGSRSAVERAEAALGAAEAEAAAARSGVRMAEQEREQARLAVAHLEGEPAPDVISLQAPVGGRVFEVLEESERSVQPGEPILRVGDPTNLEVVVDLLSPDAVRVEPGTRAEIERWGGDENLEARVRTVEPTGFTHVSALGVEEQRVNVVLDLEAPRDAWEALGDGYRVEARILIWEDEDVLVAPRSAVFQDGETWLAFRVRDGRAERVEVEVGERSDIEVQVLSGLEETDEVITYPGDRVEDGARVDVR